MIRTSSWNRIYELARNHKILKKLGSIVNKRHNAAYRASYTMSSIFKGFLRQLRIYHFPLYGMKEHISTDYRDLRRCNSESYSQAKDIVENFYLDAKKRKKIKLTIDGTFIGVRGKTFENAYKMYSGNKVDKGKKGYTLVTAFDTVNKLPMSLQVPTLHELHAAPSLINKALSWERCGAIVIDLVILDALYLNKELLDLLSGHKFIIRAPAHEWLMKDVDKTSQHGNKEIQLWGHKVVIHWKQSTDREECHKLLVTNSEYKNVWYVYGHNKQMVENYHNDLKNKLGIKRLPSRKFYAILVYFCIIILIYMLARALLLGLGMNNISCGFFIFVVNYSSSWKKVIAYLINMGAKVSKTAKSETDPT